VRIETFPVSLSAALVVATLSCGGGRVEDLPGAAGDLLAGKRPIRAEGASRPGRMTDAAISVDGGFWRTDLTSVVSGSGEVVWDLGQVRPIRCGFLQGDNNDWYELGGSEDGTNFTPMWSASPIVGKPGMQSRTVQDLQKSARYVKLTAHGGDGFYSVSELGLFSGCAQDWPPRFVAREGTPEDEAVRWKLVILGIAAVGFMLVNHKGRQDWVRLLIVIPAGIALSATLDLWQLWPLEEAEQTYVRALVAALAATLVLREYFAPERYPVRPRAVIPTLGLLALVAVASYYHFGMPQFRDNSKGRQTLVHPWDMRVYFPVAKYFDELRFDGLYVASVAAHLDNHPGMTIDQLARVNLRDLHDNEMRTVKDVADEVDSIRQRFSPARWESFKKDMKYFEDVMGAGDYLGSMQDHGGNATPVWIAGAYLLWRNAPANELTLTLTALIDPALLILMFVVLARTFGTRVMLICLIVWGTTDFSRFGTNLMGSTLRADWMVALGLGASALKTRRWALGGGLVAYGGLIRAFPAFSTFFLAVPPAWWLLDTARATRRLPALKELAAAQSPALRAMAGALGTVVVLVGISSAMFGFSGAWVAWTHKIVLHAEQPNSNHVGIRNLVAYSPSLSARAISESNRSSAWVSWQETQRQTFARRKPLFYLGVLAFLGLGLWACRGRRLDQAAIIGTLMIPVFFYPANYYCHYVFLIPLLATRRGPVLPWFEPEGRTLFGRVSGIVLAMGVVQLPTLAEWPDVTYTYESAIMMTAYALILYPLARDSWKGLKPLEIEEQDLEDQDRAADHDHGDDEAGDEAGDRKTREDSVIAEPSTIPG
jgi:hypothetical protein